MKCVKYEPKQQKDNKAKRTQNSNMKAFSGSKEFIMPNCEIIKKLGDAETIYLGVLIGQLDYFEDHKPQYIVDGYFPMTVGEVFNKIGYSYDKQDRLKKKLAGLGLIEFQQQPRHMNNLLCFRVNMEAVKTLMKPDTKAPGRVLHDKRFARRSESPPVP